MGAAIISGLFAVVLACLAWGLQNGSRRARLLSRIERYTQILKDLPYGHPARAHLDAALAAEAAQLRDLTGSHAPTFPTPGNPPSYAPAPFPYEPSDLDPTTMDDIFGTGERPQPGSPSQPPSPRPAGPSPGPSPAPPPGPMPAPAPAPGPAPAPAPATKPTQAPPPMRAPARSSRSLQAYASVALGLLAGGFAIFAIWLAIDQLLR